VPHGQRGASGQLPPRHRRGSSARFPPSCEARACAALRVALLPVRQSPVPYHSFLSATAAVLLFFRGSDRRASRGESGISSSTSRVYQEYTTQEASCATDILSQPDLAKVTLGFKAFPSKDVKSGFLDPSCVACPRVRTSDRRVPTCDSCEFENHACREGVACTSTLCCWTVGLHVVNASVARAVPGKYRGYSKLRTHTALGPYRRAISSDPCTHATPCTPPLSDRTFVPWGNMPPNATQARDV
jgi:hypothetical protein